MSTVQQTAFPGFKQSWAGNALLSWREKLAYVAQLPDKACSEDFRRVPEATIKQADRILTRLEITGTIIGVIAALQDGAVAIRVVVSQDSRYGVYLAVHEKTVTVRVCRPISKLSNAVVTEEVNLPYMYDHQIADTLFFVIDRAVCTIERQLENAASYPNEGTEFIPAGDET